MIAIGLYTALIVYIEKEYLKLGESSIVRNIPIMHTILGGVISLLLVFRTNSAYDRWWEGRKLWGDLTNTSRNLALKLHGFLLIENHADRLFYKKYIPAYAHALKNHLLSEKADWELFDRTFSLADSLKKEQHVPNQIAAAMHRHAVQLWHQGHLHEMHLPVIQEHLTAFTNICGACERIKNTPIPFSYSVFLKKFIFGYVMTLPFGFMFTLGYLAIPIVVFIFYVLASLELIAEEIEDPFGGDNNDLPLAKMAGNIHHNVDSILS
jgi:putative membrane protein